MEKLRIVVPPNMEALAKALDKCAEDLSIFDCQRCPVESNCVAAWDRIVSRAIVDIGPRGYHAVFAKWRQTKLSKGLERVR